MTAAPGARAARLILLVGVILFWVGQRWLTAVGVPFLDTLVLSLLLIVVPVLSVGQLPLMGDGAVERLPAYWGTIVTLWFLGTLSWLVGTRTGGGAAIGLVPIRPGALVTWATILTLAALGVILAFRRISTWTGTPDSPLLRQLLPQTGKEHAVFALLSVAAGVGEELAYRGYAISVLVPVMGPAGAVVLSSAVFGVVHAYQGVLGVLRTGIMGGVLAWGLLGSGSLWPPIIAHVTIDLLAGIVLGDRLLSPASPDGVDGRSDVPDAEDPWK